MATLNPGDEVIIPAPYWVTYEEIVKMAEGVPVIIEASIENDFKISEDELRNAINDKTRLMTVSYTHLTLPTKRIV